jgi:hypothetical protein
MKKSVLKLATAFVALTAVTCFFDPASATASSISSTVNQDNGDTNNGFDGNQDVYGTPTSHPGVLTTAGGYDFGSMSLTSISQITITLTLFDGNSGETGDASVEFDRDHLFLALDGITIGLGNPAFALNGFFGSQAVTKTFVFNIDPATTGADLVNALSDGHLDGTVVTDNPNDTILAPNEIFFGNLNDPSDATTTLVLTGTAAVPEPQTYALIAVGLLFLFAPALRQFRKA